MNSSYVNIPIIARSSEILDFIGIEENNRGISASELIKKFKLPKTTCYRILNALAECEFLTKDESTGYYYLGKKFAEYYTALEHKILLLKKISYPALENLSYQSKETTKISILSNMSCYVLNRIEIPMKMKISVEEGTVFPLHAGASSKILLLSISEKSRKAYFSKNLEKFTEKTIVTEEGMLKELNTISNLGYAIDNGEYTNGIGAVACPVYDVAGNIIAAVSIAYALIEQDEEKIESFIPLVKKTAKIISENYSRSHI